LVALLQAQLLHADREQADIGLTWASAGDFSDEVLGMLFRAAQSAREKDPAYDIIAIADHLPKGCDHDRLLLELVNTNSEYTPFSVIDAVATVKRYKTMKRLLGELERLAAAVAADQVGNLAWLRRRCERDLLRLDDDTQLVLDVERVAKFSHPERWPSATDPMTARQAAYISSLGAKLGLPPLEQGLTKAEAAGLIHDLKVLKAARSTASDENEPASIHEEDGGA
jgi:hypothetical protein